MFKPRFVLLFTLVGLIAGCDCLFTDWSQWLSGTERTVGDVTADNPLDPNTPALDSPAAVSDPIRLRLSNPTPYDADCRVTMELIGHEVHFSLRRILTATESLVIGPDKADIIRVEATFLADPPVVADVQILRMGEDFRPGDIVDVVLKLPPDDQGEDQQPPPPPPPPTGACCLLTGTCVVTTEDECSSEYGGEYQGDDVSCDPNPCPQPMGACCLADGNCIVTTEDECSSEYSGEYQGDDSPCDPNYCPQPTGACCLIDGTCTVTTAYECSSEYGGDYQGDDTSCDPNPCPPPTGACCSGSGYCEVMTEDDCYSHEASYMGDGTTCDPNPCVGACCFPDGTCEILTDWSCYYQGGTYQGDGTDCDPNPCPQPATGACCFADGYCQIMTEADCSISEGTYWGDGTICDPNPCPQPPPTGACCLGDYICEVRTELDCIGSQGVYMGDDTTCDPNPCLPLPGRDCNDPLVVQLPLELPYQHADTTCGLVNDYMDTCLFPYDEGEDFIFLLSVAAPAPLSVNITVDPVGVPGTGFALDSADCPPTGECMVIRADDTGAPYGIEGVLLTTGTYYLMVDTALGAGCTGFVLQIDYTNP